MFHVKPFSNFYGSKKNAEFAGNSAEKRKRPKIGNPNSSLERHGTWRFSETTERGSCILEVEDFGVFVIRRIHALEFGVGFEHMDLGFTAVIADECSAQTEPLIAGLVHSAKLDLAVFLDLLRDIFGLAGLDVELALENFDGPERAYFRFVAINRCEEIGAAFLDKVFDFFHYTLLNEITVDNI